MRYEVITGVERRRRWPDEEKLTILGEVGVDGETVASVARRHDITRQHIYQWRTEMRRKGLISDRKGLLVPVEVAEDAVSGTSDAHSGSVDLIEVVLTNGDMIGPGTGVRVYLACGVTDMRKGIAGLAAIVQDQLRQKPASGSVFAFRGRRGDRVKILYFDGQGYCLYYKILEKGRFPWPSAADGTARLTSAQLAMLWEGIDWRRPNWGTPPERFS
ncbi:unnamed protein product [Symbiodinium pilosum]|uniref:Transposase n=3 Tax=cellular organisms TaxID=131567 RepID=A0A812T045_SYMPI|nr:unnamed protein product [Symbiodinium pilosum]CAE7876625.1 unnamed protein product [Symbiodinium necroappetens]